MLKKRGDSRFVQRLQERLTRSFYSRLIIYIPCFLALLEFLIIGPWIGGLLYGNNVPSGFYPIVWIIGFFIISISGMIQIICQEIPGFYWSIQGKAAVIGGVIWVLFFWALGFLIFWDAFLR